MNGPGINQVYTGVQSYRGIMVDTWQSCQYWAAYDATMKVSWYFSSKLLVFYIINWDVKKTNRVTKLSIYCTKIIRATCMGS